MEASVLLKKESNSVLKESLLVQLYRGEMSLPRVYWGYGLFLGVFVFCVWLLLLLVPVWFCSEQLLQWVEPQIPELTDEWRLGLEVSRWVLIALLPALLAPSVLYFHSLMMVLPLWRTLQRCPFSSFWGTVWGHVLVMFPVGVVVFVGTLLVVVSVLFSFLGLLSGPPGAVIFGVKLGLFVFGLIPHAVLALCLYLWRVPPVSRMA